MQNQSFSLEGKVAFVTGAARGIGFTIAKGWAQAGASIACFDLHQDDADRAAQEIATLGVPSIGIETQAGCRPARR